MNFLSNRYLKTIIIFLLCFFATNSIEAKSNKNEKKYTFDSFVKFIGTTSNEDMNSEKFYFRLELENYYVQDKGYESAVRFIDSKDDDYQGLIAMIKIKFNKNTKYLTKYFDFPNLNKATPSKKDALKFIKSFGEDFEITEIQDGKNGNIYATYKKYYEVVFVITGKRIKWIAVKIGEGAPDFRQIEYEKYGPRGILGNPDTYKSPIHIFPSSSYSRNINFKDTILSEDLDENTHFEGIYKRGMSSGTLTYKSSNGTISYQGEFLNWYADGKGTLTHSNGDATVGIWKEGLLREVDSMPFYGCIYSGKVDFDRKPKDNGIVFCDDKRIEGNFKEFPLQYKEQRWGKQSFMYEVIGENYHYEGVINENFEPDGPGSLTSLKYKIKSGIFVNGVPWSGKGTILPMEPNGIELNGRFKNGVFISEGSIELENGIIYDGITDINGLYHQKGKFIFPNGDYLNVEYDHGKFISSSGDLTINGDKYSGNFNEQNKLHGGGGIVYMGRKKINGHYQQISGDFKNGVYQGGLGLISLKDGWYEGELNGSLTPHGQGERTYTSGHSLEGKFVNGIYEGGEGVIVFKDGTYQGDLNDSLQPHGTGTSRDKNGNSFTGKFENGVVSGSGVLIRSDGSTFSGNFYGDEFQGGDGYIKYSDGSIYDGEVNANFKPHGYGRIYSGDAMNPTAYVSGTYKNGAFMGGNGNKKYPDGFEYTGILDVNGQPDGNGVFERNDNSLFDSKSITLFGVFKGRKSIGDASLTYKTRNNVYEFIGPLNSKFNPDGYGKERVNGGEWKYVTLKGSDFNK